MASLHMLVEGWRRLRGHYSYLCHWPAFLAGERRHGFGKNLVGQNWELGLYVSRLM